MREGEERERRKWKQSGGKKSERGNGNGEG